MKDRITGVNEHLREREKSEGIDGYHGAKMTLEAKREVALDLNEEKGQTLEDISNIVSRIAEIIAEKKETLQPQMDLLKKKKAMATVMEQEHREKKERYERLSLRFSTDRQAVEKEASLAQEEWKDVDASYRELLSTNDGAKIDLKKLENYSNISAEYEDKLAQKRSAIERLRDEKQNIMNNHSEGSKQRSLFLNLEKLLRLTQAMRAGNDDERDVEDVIVTF